MDVRAESAYDRGHIPTTINIPFDFILKTKNPLPKDEYIMLYCCLGRLAQDAEKEMLAAGYRYIFVWGGITNWPYEIETSK